jgi:hypothetical protein
MWLKSSVISVVHEHGAESLPRWLHDGKIPALQADMLTTLDEGFEEAKWAFLRIQDGKLEWYSAVSRIVHSTSSFGRSREMKQFLLPHGKWWC